MADYLTQDERDRMTPKVQNIVEGARKIVDAKGGTVGPQPGSLTNVTYQGSLDDIRAKHAAYLQSTTERRAQTDERMDDLNTRTGTQVVDNTQQEQQDTGYESSSYYYDADTAGNQVVGKVGRKNVITGAKDLPDLDSLTGIDRQIAEIEIQSRNRIATINRDLNRIGQQVDGAHQNLISSIQQIYGARIQEMEDANRRLYQTKQTIGIRQGRARYTPVHQAGILADEEIAGVQRVARLEGEMMAAIAQAEQAKADNDLKLFNNAYDRIEQAEKNMNNEIQGLYEQAVKQQEAFVKMQEDERKAQQQEFDNMLELSERSAPALASRISSFGTPEEQAAFIGQFADAMGIDPFVLLGDVQNALSDQQKVALDMENIRNTMENRDQNTRIAGAREGRLQSEYNRDVETEEIEKTVRNEIIQRLTSGTLTIDQARELWATAGLPVATFDKEFASFIDDNVDL